MQRSIIANGLLQGSSANKDIIPTDPAAQKSVLANSGSKLKVSIRPAANVKLTNLPSVQAIGTSSTAKVGCLGSLY